MDLNIDIKKGLYALYGKSKRKLNAIDKPAYIFSLYGEKGVGVVYNDKKQVMEAFNSVRYQTQVLEGVTYLMVLTQNENLSKQFVMLCVDFIQSYYENEEAFQIDPLDWWVGWSDLLGNKKSLTTIYSVMGEVLVYNYFKKIDDSTEWKAEEYATHDIESNTRMIEVKSSTVKHSTIIHISSKYQGITETKPLDLVFCRFEKTSDGYSMRDILNMCHIDERNEIIAKLAKLGFDQANHVFDEKYKLLESKLYPVDKDFPLIKEQKYDDGQFPNRVLSVNYDVSLDGYEKCQEINLLD